GCENISCNSILSYEYSPLSIGTFFSKEGCIEDEDGGSVGGEMGIYANIALFLDENTSSNLRGIVRIEYPVSSDNSASVCLRTE
ncbi:MAG: hypothetical protein WC774_05905, partial [Candidatus Gracilibacteria bacterium]